ncbi:hypothetical protein [Amycolatopsis thermoflava]|uniref:hypothetical protein n=1 Tax=Amycolatopsis thermoflava TaxID=84480 RepID=UPI0038086A32
MSGWARAGWVAFGAVLGAAPVVVRIWLLGDGEVYGAGVGDFNAAMAACVVLGAICVYHGVVKQTAAPQGAVALLSGLVAIGTGAFATAQYFFPETPRQAAAPACHNAPLEGAGFYVQTTEQGVNTRSGPGRQFEQTGRFPASCTVGVDGYCLGEPLDDLTLPPHLPDRRWLRVHGLPSQYIPAAFVGFQGGEGPLGDPDASCADHGGLPAGPPVAALSLANTGPATMTMRAGAPGAYLVGYAATPTDQVTHTFVQLGQSRDRSGFPVTWNVGDVNPFPQGTDGEVWIAAAVCFAGNAPQAGSVRVARVPVSGGAAVQATLDTDNVTAEVRRQLEQAACARSAITPSG